MIWYIFIAISRGVHQAIWIFKICDDVFFVVVFVFEYFGVKKQWAFGFLTIQQDEALTNIELTEIKVCEFGILTYGIE